MDNKPAIEIQVDHENDNENDQVSVLPKLGPQLGKVNVLVSTYKHGTEGNIIRMSFDKSISQLDMTIESVEVLIRKLVDAHVKIKREKSTRRRQAELAKRKKYKRRLSRKQRKVNRG